MTRPLVFLLAALLLALAAAPVIHAVVVAESVENAKPWRNF